VNGTSLPQSEIQTTVTIEHRKLCTDRRSARRFGVGTSNDRRDTAEWIDGAVQLGTLIGINSES
jgi:hypothetical protein